MKLLLRMVLLRMVLGLLRVHTVLLRGRGRVQPRLRLQLSVVYHPCWRGVLHTRCRRGVRMLGIVLLWRVAGRGVAGGRRVRVVVVPTGRRRCLHRLPRRIRCRSRLLLWLLARVA